MKDITKMVHKELINYKDKPIVGQWQDYVEKIKIPQDTWIQLYGELSEFMLENQLGKSIFEQDENGDETIQEQYQDEYCHIVGEVEEILGLHFIKEEK